MTLKQIVKRMEKKQYLIDMGAGKLSKWFKCSKEDIYEARKIIRNKKVIAKKPKILIFDIETAPLKVYVWNRWKQNVYLPQTISEWFTLTWSAKWLFDGKIMSARLTSEEVKNEDDKRIVKELWTLFNEADMVVAHNGDKFDIPRMNSRFLVNGLNPTTPYHSIDTKKIAAKQFGFSSNKLDALAGYFGFEHKLDTDFELWVKCMNGDEKALEYMETYNKYDVELLENIYIKLRPWIKSHPNVGLYLDSEEPVCANCGSKHINKETQYYTSTGRYDVYRCECGALSRVRQHNQDKKVRKNMLISVAK